MAGAVLCTLNTRHDSAMVLTLLKHSETKIIFVDYQFLHIAQEAIDILSQTSTKLPLLILIPESDQLSPKICNTISTSNNLEYECLLGKGRIDFEIRRPNDEWDRPISLNYTLGTTPSPKGVIFNHRDAYLNSLATVLLSEMSSMPVYLWCVPMFHCNGWCLSWGACCCSGWHECVPNECHCRRNL